MASIDIVRQMMRDSNPIQSLLFRKKQEYDEAKKNFDFIQSNGIMQKEQVDAALQVLESYWQKFVDKCEAYIPMKQLPVAPLPPMIDRRKHRGIIAFREWQNVAIDEGKLAPLVMGMHCEWKPIMYADEVPTKSNRNGLYGRELGPNLVTGYGGYAEGKVWGLIELLGHIEEHTDGVYRAEKVEVISLYMPVDSEQLHVKLVMGALESLSNSFFPVPVYPVSMAQSKLVLMREVIINCGVKTY